MGVRPSTLAAILAQSSAPAAALPATPLGVWYSDEYDAATRSIRNAAAPATASASVWRGTRRLFGTNHYWTKSSATATDLAATGADGATSASTIVGTGNWRIVNINATNLPNGTYTIAATVRRGGGSDQQFAFTATSGTVRSSAQTAGASFSRHSWTFVASGTPNNQVGICTVDGTTGADLIVDSIELFAGASDLGASSADGVAYLGVLGTASAPTATGGYVDYSTGGFASIALPQASVAQMTAIAVINKVASGSTYDGFLSSVRSFTALSALNDTSNGTAATAFNGLSTYNVAALWALQGQGWHMLTHRYNGSKRQLWVDDFLLFEVSATVSAVTINDLWMGIVSNTSLTSGCRVNSVALYDRALTDTEIRTAYAALSARAALSSISMSPARVLVQEGDSITAASGAPLSYSYRYGANQSPKVVGRNFATGGSAISHATARAAAVDSILPPNRAGRRFILSVLLGTNNLTTDAPATYLANMAAYLDARRAAGWHVALCTLLPRTDVGFNAKRAAVNTEFRLWTTGGSIVPGIHADEICDFDSNPTIGGDAAASNATYYSDGLHPTDAGHALLEPIYRAVINGIA